MNEADRAALKIVIEPICKIVAESYQAALLLRCNVAYDLAVYNGAEAEDLGDVIANAIQSSQPLTKHWLDEIGMVKRAQDITKGEFE